jgi:methylthioribulose-1-phosphate dehydratase
MKNLSAELIEIGRSFHSRGWVLGTSGNFSAVIERSPLRLAITASGADKGHLTPDEILDIDASGIVIAGEGKPSDETKLHLAIVARCEARAVLHTHSVWSTILGEANASKGGLEIAGYEMLKGLAGVRTHLHREWLPIVDNSQDMDILSNEVETMLTENPAAHGFLISGHGLYTWGSSLAEAERHVEILEFLLEVTGRTSARH